MRRLALFVSFFALASACSRCDKKTTTRDAGPTSFEVSYPRPVKAPTWSELSGSSGFGLPSGCRFDGKIQSTPRPEGKARIFAGRRRLDALAIAVEVEGHVDRAGLVDLRSREVTAVPWAELDAPPLFDNRQSSWFAAWSDDAVPRRALGWTGGARANLLAEGDDLELVDVACAGDRCAALTTLARETRSAGATLSTTDGKREDIDAPKADPWAPFAILDFNAERTRVGLSSGKRVAIWEAEKDGPFSEKKTLDAPFGAYGGTGNWVVTAGAPPDRPCGKDEFPIDIHGSKKLRITTPAPPEHIVVRSLGAHLLVAWVAPVSCQLLERRVVYLTLVSPNQADPPSPMAVADATAFAISSQGDRFSLWLLGDESLIWLSGRC